MGLEKSISINIIGGDFEDMVLLESRILQCCGFKTVLWDHTHFHRLFSLFPHIDDLEPKNLMTEYRGVYYTLKEDVCEEKNDSPHINIFLYDFDDICEKKLYGEKNIYVINESRHFLEYLQKYVAESENIMIVRNYTGVEDKQINMVSDKIKSIDVYALPFFVRDHKCGIMAGNKGIFKFGRISTEYERLLKNIFRFIIPDTDEKLLNKAYHRASKGVKL